MFLNRPYRLTRSQEILIGIGASILASAFLLWLVSLCSGCTIAPAPVTASVPSWDQTSGLQNSGVLGVVLPDGSELIGNAALAHHGPVSGWIISQDARNRYNGLIKEFGFMAVYPYESDMGISIRKDGTWFMSNSGMAAFADMSRYRRSISPSVSPVPPTNSPKATP